MKIKTKMQDLMIKNEERKLIEPEFFKYPSLKLSFRHLCDIELLLNGAFYPLNGFMNQNDYNSVVNNMRLIDGTLWPIPITLDVSHEVAKSINIKDKIILRDQENFPIAIFIVSDIWEPELEKEAMSIYGTSDDFHPGVNYLLNKVHKFYLGGELKGLSLPRHFDYLNERHTPAQLKQKFHENKWGKIIAFQTRNPLHRAHVEMIKIALKDLSANLLIHAVVGITKPGDIDHYTRVRCYMHVLEKFPKKSVMLSLIPLAMRMAGPLETLWHAIIRKNYGCTHLIVGRDHAGPGLDKNGLQFYEPYEAQDLLIKYKDEINIEIVPFKFMVYLPNTDRYSAIDELGKRDDYKTLSGTELRQLLDNGNGIPHWFTYREVSRELEKARPPLTRRGLTIFFTGLSGAGKSTLANGLLIKLLEEGSRPVTLLDGDIVRTHLSSELGFSKKDRSINIQRIGFVASEITKNGGIAICAPIAPYSRDRDQNRKLISSLGGYIEVYVSTSLEICEERDAKGLYRKARKGIIGKFTGISDPYEVPDSPEIVIDSSNTSPDELVNELYLKICDKGYIKKK